MYKDRHDEDLDLDSSALSTGMETSIASTVLMSNFLEKLQIKPPPPKCRNEHPEHSISQDATKVLQINKLYIVCENIKLLKTELRFFCR